MSKFKKIVIHSDRCTGCRSCEMACSFHHTKKFSPSFSSIEVYRNEENGIFKLRIYTTKDTKERVACDLCKNEEEPLCIKYCTTKALELNGE